MKHRITIRIPLGHTVPFCLIGSIIGDKQVPEMFNPHPYITIQFRAQDGTMGKNNGVSGSAKKRVPITAI